MDSRFPDFQELDLEPERACQDVAGTLEVDYFFYFWILGLLTLLWEKRQRLSKHYHQHCYWELEKTWVSVQTLSANWGCSIQSELCLQTQQTWYLDFCWRWFLPPYYWRRHPFHWTTVTQEAFSHHDVAFTSTPVLFYPDSAQPFIVKSESSSQIAKAVLSQQRPSLFHECAFLRLKPSETHIIGPGDFFSY